MKKVLKEHNVKTLLIVLGIAIIAFLMFGVIAVKLHIM